MWGRWSRVGKQHGTELGAKVLWQQDLGSEQGEEGGRRGRRGRRQAGDQTRQQLGMRNAQAVRRIMLVNYPAAWPQLLKQLPSSFSAAFQQLPGSFPAAARQLLTMRSTCQRPGPPCRTT